MPTRSWPRRSPTAPPRRVAVGLALLCAVVVAACSNQAVDAGSHRRPGCSRWRPARAGPTLTGWDATGADGTPIKLPQGDTTWISAGRAAVLAATLASGQDVDERPRPPWQAAGLATGQGHGPDRRDPGRTRLLRDLGPGGRTVRDARGRSAVRRRDPPRARRPIRPDGVRDRARSIGRRGAAGLDRRRSRRRRHR